MTKNELIIGTLFTVLLLAAFIAVDYMEKPLMLQFTDLTNFKHFVD